MVYFGCLNLDVQIWCQNQVTLDLPFYYGLSWRPLDLIRTLTLWLNLLMRHQICLITTDMSSHLECLQGLATTTDLQCTILFGCCGTSPVLARLLCILCCLLVSLTEQPTLAPLNPAPDKQLLKCLHCKGLQRRLEQNHTENLKQNG